MIQVPNELRMGQLRDQTNQEQDDFGSEQKGNGTYLGLNDSPNVCVSLHGCVK